MADQKSGTRNSVGLLDIARQVPGLLMDTPTILRGVVTGFGARPSAKTSIGKVFQDRAAQYGDKLFLKFEDQAITYRQANETVNRYAAVLAARGVGHGDVVGIMLRNSPDPVLLMLAAVKCGAISGMLNYNQRGDVLKHSLGLLSATVIVADPDFVDPIKDSGADTEGLVTLDEFKKLAETAPTENPPTASAVLAKDKAFYIFTSGTTGMPKASIMTHYRWLRALAGFGGLGTAQGAQDEHLVPGQAASGFKLKERTLVRLSSRRASRRTTTACSRCSTRSPSRRRHMIADALGYDRSHLVGVLDDLEARELIERAARSRRSPAAPRHARRTPAARRWRRLRTVGERDRRRVLRAAQRPGAQGAERRSLTRLAVHHDPRFGD